MDVEIKQEHVEMVLVVDDEPQVLATLKRQLRREFDVRTADSGAAALDILACENVDVIISDQRMPGMNGAQLLAEARKLRPDCACIMLTGYSDQQAVVEAVNRGRIQGYMTKPWDVAEIRTTVREAAQTARLRKQNKQLLVALKTANEQLEQRVSERTEQLQASTAPHK